MSINVSHDTSWYTCANFPSEGAFWKCIYIFIPQILYNLLMTLQLTELKNYQEARSLRTLVTFKAKLLIMRIR